ncbi:MAG: ABC transporter ATP-binding protein, partial [Oscillospiraceae bacterium]
MAVIETKKLTKSYGKARGITELDLTVNEGEFFGFIGPNGAGKSTTIRTLLGLIFPTSGEAKVFGKDIVRDKTEILARVGYMPSEAAFYNGMRVKEVIALSAKLRKADCSAEAVRLCERLELDTEKRIEELSLGNRKKVAVVCALQHKPDLCVLDEPTSGLDPLMQKEFFNILNERHAAGATIFLSSHVLSEIQKYCSRAAIIKEGRLIALDSVENL